MREAARRSLHGFSERVFAAYVEARGKSADPHIMRRAALAAEFALAQWLVKSLDSKDAERIADAEEMLQELDTNIAEYGGQPLSVVEAPRPLAAPAPVLAPEVPSEPQKASAPAINTSKVTQLAVDDDPEPLPSPEDAEASAEQAPQKSVSQEQVPQTSDESADATPEPVAAVKSEDSVPAKDTEPKEKTSS